MKMNGKEEEREGVLKLEKKKKDGHVNIRWFKINVGWFKINDLALTSRGKWCARIDFPQPTC